MHFGAATRCNVPVDAAAHCRLHTLQSKLVAETHKAIRIAKHNKRLWSNMTPLVHWGMKLLKGSCWKVLLADEAGGYVLSIVTTSLAMAGPKPPWQGPVGGPSQRVKPCTFWPRNFRPRPLSALVMLVKPQLSKPCLTPNLPNHS